MYIEPFWCGVIATILFEVGCSVLMVVLLDKKEDGGRDEEEK